MTLPTLKEVAIKFLKLLYKIQLFSWMLVVIVEVFNIQAGSSGSLLLELRKKQDWVIVFSTRQNIVWLEMDGRVFLMPLETC